MMSGRFWWWVVWLAMCVAFPARAATSAAERAAAVARRIVTHFEPLWSVPVGSTAGGNGGAGTAQIAVRGSLIVVASRGRVLGGADDQDGVYVIDGRSSTPDTERIVRHLPSWEDGPDDAVGVALDGDFVVFGVGQRGVAKVRLDGRVAWRTPLGARRQRIGAPALADVNGDGVRDALVPLEACDPTPTPCPAGEDRLLIVALDGSSGRELWSLQSPADRRPDDCFDHIVSASGRRAIIECRGQAVFEVGLLEPEYLEEPTGQASDPRELQALFELPLTAAARPEMARMPPSGGAGAFGAQVRLSAYGLTEPGTRRLEIDSRYGPQEIAVYDASAVTGDGLLAHDAESVAARFDGVIQSYPSLGDVDGDGAWELLIVAGGSLRVLSTGSRGEVPRALWRGDVAAAGVAPRVDTPAAYASRRGPRDEQRWLARDRPAASRGAWLEVTGLAATLLRRLPYEREPIEVARETGALLPAVRAQVECGERYGLNEGNLVVLRDAEWRRLPDAPWPVQGLACSDGELLLECGADRLLRLARPLPWQTEASIALSAIVVAAVVAGWFTSRGGRDVPPPADPAARRVLISDGPRTLRHEAHPRQERLIAGLINVLDNDDTRPPVTVALYGAWGSGKSSIMQMLRSELRDTGRYIHVWFNAWRFQREKELAPALLQSIVDEVGRQSDWVTRVAVLWNRTRGATLRQVVQVLLPACAALLVLAVCVRVSTGGEALSVTQDNLGKLGTIASVLALFAGAIHRVLGPLLKVFSLDPAKLLVSTDPKRRIQFVRAFASEFEQISTRLPRGTRLVIFIDDLDRCPPDRVVNVLETLSMLADTGCGFFVLAIDPVSVRRAIEFVYRDMLEMTQRDDAQEAAHFAQRYLEKMVTLEVNVPTLAAIDVEPDARLEFRNEMGALEWLRTRVLPEPPLLMSLVAIALVTFLGSREPALVNAGLDGVSRLLFGAPAAPALAAAVPAGRTPAPVPGASSAPPAPPAAASLAPRPLDDERAPSAAPSPVAGGSPGAASLSVHEREPVLSAASPPALVVRAALDTPSENARVSEVVARIIAVLGSLVALAIVALVVAELRRRRRIGRGQPMGSDSETFSSGLRACKKLLPAHPRSVIRFTNLARFLYHVMQTATPDPAERWAPAFFAALGRRAVGVKPEPGQGWLDDELEHWAPSTHPVSVPPSSGVRTTSAQSPREALPVIVEARRPP